MRARDPLLLAAGCLAVALVPWNQAAWWMLRRLRAAVEMDCDARVLRRGARRHAYGTLLVEMAGRGPGLSLGAPALAGPPSTLERRLRAMNARLPRFARLRAALMGVLALTAAAAACDTRLPTAGEVEQMDVAQAESRAREVRALLREDGALTYFIDGREVTREEALALAPDRIARMEMTRAAARIHTTLRPGVERAEVRARRQATAAAGPDQVVLAVTTPAGGMAHVVPANGFSGLLVIDGVIAEPAALRSIRPDGIAALEVIKGAAATRMYDDPRAANGVIRITTQAAPPRR